MEPPWFDPETYRSDSNQHWRSGCPHEELRAGAFPWLQLLTHPEIWVYPGTRWARRCARCSRRRRSAGSTSSPPTGSTSREGRHRPRLRLRRARHRGAPEGPARERRADGAARRHRHERALGRPPPLRRVPPRAGRLRPRLRRRRARRSSSARASTSSCRSRRSTSKASPRTATASRCRCSSPRRTRSTARTTRPRRTRCCSGSASRAPTSGASTAPPRSPRRREELGYPDRPVCFKPVFSSGSRGFRILDPTVDRAHQLLNERPGSRGDAARGGGRAAPGRGRPRPARDGAGDRRRADDRRHRRRRRASCSATRRRARRCAPGSRCTSSRSRTRS